MRYKKAKCGKYRNTEYRTLYRKCPYLDSLATFPAGNTEM